MVYSTLHTIGFVKFFSFRDTFVYAISADNRGLDAVTNILAEVVLRPQISESEVNSILLHSISK